MILNLILYESKNTVKKISHIHFFFFYGCTLDQPSCQFLSHIGLDKKKKKISGYCLYCLKNLEKSSSPTPYSKILQKQECY